MVLLSLLGIPEKLFLICHSLQQCPFPWSHWQSLGKSWLKAISRIAPANIHLSELQVWEAIISGKLAEDMGEVDTCGRPGGVEGHNPNHLGKKRIQQTSSNRVIHCPSAHLCISSQFFSETVSTEVCDVLRTFVCWLGEQHALEFIQ